MENASTALTPEQLREFAARLDAREAQVGAEVRASHDETGAEPGRSTGGMPGDLADQGEALAREVVRDAEMERDLAELRQIAGAKERLRLGGYGQCVDCGAAIPAARLEVLPYSERCVPCQEKFEAARALLR